MLILTNGLLRVKDTPFELLISYSGNLGGTMRAVNRELKSLGYPSIRKLKKLYPNHGELGSPSYYYVFKAVKG